MPFLVYKELVGPAFYPPKGKAAYLRMLSQPFSHLAEDYEEALNLERKAVAEYLKTTSGKGSFPERVVESFLSALKIEFAREVVFDWSRPSNNESIGQKRYDFYIPSLSLIIEVHGIQHYEGGFESLGGRTLEEEQANDQFKKTLALQNGIREYVEIDASTSDLIYIRKSIESSTILNRLFDLKAVDWDFVAQNIKTDTATVVELPVSDFLCRHCQEWIEVIRQELTPEDSKAHDADSDSHKVTPNETQNTNVGFATKYNLTLIELKALRDSKYYSYPIRGYA